MDDDERERVLDEAEATLARLDRFFDLRPRAVPIDVPSGLDRWRAEANEQEQRRRAETRRRRQKEAEMTAQANDDYWAAIDQRIAAAIEAALKIERKNNRAVMAEVLAQLQHAIDERLTRATTQVDAAATQVEKVSSEIRRMNADRPDADGILRRQFFTPEPH